MSNSSLRVHGRIWFLFLPPPESKAFDCRQDLRTDARDDWEEVSHAVPTEGHELDVIFAAPRLAGAARAPFGFVTKMLENPRNGGFPFWPASKNPSKKWPVSKETYTSSSFVRSQIEECHPMAISKLLR